MKDYIYLETLLTVKMERFLFCLVCYTKSNINLFFKTLIRNRASSGIHVFFSLNFPKSNRSYGKTGTKNFNCTRILLMLRSRGSSGSLVTDYGLDDRGSIPDRCRGFFF
jgi:hypothetical protein